MHSFSNWDRNKSAKKYAYSRLYSTIISPKLKFCKESSNINPWFFTGYVDAEGCFSIRVRKTTQTRGWQVELIFSIGLHLWDLSVLQEIQAYLGGIGRISVGKNCGFYVSSIKDLTTVIIPHFVKYPLISRKQGDFLLFKSVVEMINAKEHLTLEGLQKIVSIKASVNWGLTNELKVAFPNTIPALKSLAVNTEIPHPYWMAGFTSGEGCFSVIKHNSNSRIYLKLVFSITQDKKDESLIKSFIDYFGCGRYYPASKRTTGDFQCRKFSDNYEKLIPFFRKYNIKGVKLQDFENWCKIAEIIRTKNHLTKEGFDLSCQIISGMNKRG